MGAAGASSSRAEGADEDMMASMTANLQHMLSQMPQEPGSEGRSR